MPRRSHRRSFWSQSRLSGPVRRFGTEFRGRRLGAGRSGQACVLKRLPRNRAPKLPQHRTPDPNSAAGNTLIRMFGTQLLVSTLGCRPEDTWSFSHLRTRLLCRSDGLATAVLRTGQASCWLSCSSVVSFEVCFHLPWLTFSVTGFHHDPTTREICFSYNSRITFRCACKDFCDFIKC